MAIAKAQQFKTEPFKIRPSKSLDFKCFRILTGQVSDPLCIRIPTYFYPFQASCVSAKSPLACFVALQLCHVGHLQPDILHNGLEHLHFLSLNGRYDHVMECLLNMSPVFLDNLEPFWSSELLRRTVEIIVTADQTYFKMAKDLITVDFPGPVLKELGNMMTRQLVDFQRYVNHFPIINRGFSIRSLVNLRL